MRATELTAEEMELLKRLIRPQAGKIPADEFDLRISLWQKLVLTSEDRFEKFIETDKPTAVEA